MQTPAEEVSFQKQLILGNQNGAFGAR